MEATDLALLDRWTTHRDAEAFAELVSRHSSTVYAACHRVLRNEADAKETAQECFIALLQDPPLKNRQHSSLAGWLHTVATRRALNRVKSEQRRRQREQQHPLHTEGGGNEFDDVQAFVDEAIANLPDELREPVVAHFLEGRSHQAIAESLGMPRRTVTSRIAKGIEEVRATLRRRGVLITTSALVSVLTVESAQAAPLGLTAALGKLALAEGAAAPVTVVGTGSAAALLGGILAMKNIVVSVVTGAVILAAGLWYLAPTQAPVIPAPAPSNASAATAKAIPAAPPPPPPTLVQTVSVPGPSVSGIVADSHGQPIEGATASLRYDGAPKDGPSVVTGKDGAFSLMGPRAGKLFFVRAVKEGMLQGHGKLDEMTKDGMQGLVVTLYRAGGVEGIVVDPSGRALANLPVTSMMRDIDVKDTGSSLTDKNGHFQIGSLLPSAYSLAVIPEQDMRPDVEDIQTEVKEGEITSALRLVYKGDGLVIAGRVTDESGAPLKGVFVQALYKELSPSTSTDAEGKYRLRRLPEGPHPMMITHDGFENLWTEAIETGREDADFTLKSIAGDTVRGRVVDAVTGDPITEFQILNRRGVWAGLSWTDTGASKVTSFHTFRDESGRFEVTKVAADGATLITRARGYAVNFAPLNLSTGKGRADIVIRLVRSRIVTGTVVNAAGEPISEAYIFAYDRPPLANWKQMYSNDQLTFKLFLSEAASAQSDATGRFQLDYLDSEPRGLSAYHVDYGFGSVELPSADRTKGEVKIVLTRGGRIEGQITCDGQAMPGVQVTARLLNDYEDFGSGREVRTSANGAYVFDEVPEGEVEVYVNFSGDTFPPFRRHTIATIQVKDGQVTQVPFVFRAGHHTLEGAITAAGQPATDCRVQLLMEAPYGVERSQAHVGKDGRYDFSDLPSGTGALLIWYGDLVKWEPVEISDTVTPNVNVDFSGSAGIVGSVSGLSPMENASVMVLTGTMQPSRFTDVHRPAMRPSQRGRSFIGQGGSYSVQGLEPGTYVVVAGVGQQRQSGPDYDRGRMASQVVTLHDGEQIGVNFDLR